MYKTISFFLKVSLITYHKYPHSTKGNTNPVYILVWHSILFTIGYRMVFSMAISIIYRHVLLTKKIIGSPAFHFSIMPVHMGQYLQG